MAYPNTVNVESTQDEGREWSYDGTLRSSGSGNTMTLVLGVGATLWRFRKFGLLLKTASGPTKVEVIASTSLGDVILKDSWTAVSGFCPFFSQTPVSATSATLFYFDLLLCNKLTVKLTFGSEADVVIKLQGVTYDA